MSIELDKIDCNCNNCIFMERNISKYKDSIQLHRTWQDEYVANKKKNMLKKATNWREMGLIDKALNIEKEARKIKPNYQKPIIQYGKCTKFGKDVSFIPNTVQLDTQICFKHRRDEHI